MKKQLSEMTLEELWRLFPIRLTAHNPDWKDWFEEERALLSRVLPAEQVVRISHIGSTAIDTIWAKPTVDILAETCAEPGSLLESATSCGYTLMSGNPVRLSLCKGYTPDGFAERVYHLHIHRAGDNGELYFRDYLIEHPELARKYEALKRELWKRFEFDRDAYTNAKGDFVRTVTQAAKAAYPDRYDM